MPLKWTEELTVGVADIDRQHQEFIDEFNALIQACNSHQGRDRIPELLRFLEEFVASHFPAEERLMSLHSYPDADEHRQEHRVFIAKVAELKQELTSDGPSMSLIIHTNETLLRWFISHIKKVDTRLGEFLQGRL